MTTSNLERLIGTAVELGAAKTLETLDILRLKTIDAARAELRQHSNTL